MMSERTGFTPPRLLEQPHPRSCRQISQLSLKRAGAIPGPQTSS
jgi:hypothetical protein